MRVLAFDTSNYTTSVASFDGTAGHNISRLLDVEQGALGLRQSDALFAHVKRLPELADRLFSDIGTDAGFEAVGVSTRPRAVEGSYMPCFLAGESRGPGARRGARCARPAVFASAGAHRGLTVGLRPYGADGRAASGLASFRRHDGASARHAGGEGQRACREDRRHDGHLRRSAHRPDRQAARPAVSVRQAHRRPEPFRAGPAGLPRQGAGTAFSLSGVQNKVEQYHAAGNSPEETAGYALRCLIGAIVRATENALLEYPGSSVVFAGGVASNTLLRSSCAALPAVFCPPQFATDNALGVAVLTWRALHG